MKLKQILTALVITVFLTLNTLSAAGFSCVCNQSSTDAGLHEVSTQEDLPCHHDRSDQDQDQDHQDQSNESGSCDGSCACHYTHTMINFPTPKNYSEFTIHFKNDHSFYRTTIFARYADLLKRPPKYI